MWTHPAVVILIEAIFPKQANSSQRQHHRSLGNVLCDLQRGSKGEACENTKTFSCIASAIRPSGSVCWWELATVIKLPCPSRLAVTFLSHLQPGSAGWANHLQLHWEYSYAFKTQGPSQHLIGPCVFKGFSLSKKWDLLYGGSGCVCCTALVHECGHQDFSLMDSNFVDYIWRTMLNTIFCPAWV